MAMHNALALKMLMDAEIDARIRRNPQEYRETQRKCRPLISIKTDTDTIDPNWNTSKPPQLVVRLHREVLHE